MFKKKKSQLSDLDSWVRQDASLISEKLQARTEEGHLTVAFGSDVGITIRTVPKLGEIAVLHRSNLHLGSLEQIEGTRGSRTLTLVPEIQPEQPVDVKLTICNNGKRKPIITRNHGGVVSLSYNPSGQDREEVNSVMETLTQGFYHKPLLSTTMVLYLKKTVIEDEVWAEIDGKYVDLASIDTVTIDLSLGQRKVLSQQLHKLQMNLRMLGDPTQHAKIPSEILKQFDLEKIPGDYEKFLEKCSIVSQTIERWNLTI